MSAVDREVERAREWLAAGTPWSLESVDTIAAMLVAYRAFAARELVLAARSFRIAVASSIGHIEPADTTLRDILERDYADIK